MPAASADELLGWLPPQRATPLDASHCVYVHVWDELVVVDVADLFRGCELRVGGRSSHDLRARVDGANLAGQLTLAYAGHTVGSTIGARIKADNCACRGNVMMRTRWDWQPPQTLLAFELAPAARAAGGSAAVVMLMKFLVSRAQGSTGSLAGRAALPACRSCVGCADASRLVQELGIRTQQGFHAWTKASPDTRSELGIPFGPDRAYRGDSWTNWNDFLGTARCAYADAETEVQRRGIRTAPEFDAWAKASPDTRSKLGDPVQSRHRLPRRRLDHLERLSAAPDRSPMPAVPRWLSARPRCGGAGSGP